MVQYQDYYQILGVERTASAEEIQKAYRKLARKFHPDINKEKGAEEQFKKINEAHDVLEDPKKRKLYDSLGENWKAGQDFRPPPDWEELLRQSGGSFGRGGRAQAGGGATFSFGGGGLGGFSDFFEAIFGDGGAFTAGGGFSSGAEEMFAGARGRRAPQAIEAELKVTVEELYHSGSKQVNFELQEATAGGAVRRTPKSYRVKIPPGTKEGSSIRLAGQGGQTAQGTEVDVIFKIQILPHPKFTVSEYNLSTALPISPWEATLGAQIDLEAVDGLIKVKVPAGSQSGQKLRITGKGLPKTSSSRGDLFVELKIVVPKELSSKERELMESLRNSSNFNPRTAK